MAKKVLNQALEALKPTKEEEKVFFDRINLILKEINSGLKGAKAVLGGSASKGTWLKDAHDADIFVQFNYNQFKDKSDKLSDILEKHLNKKFKNLERIHGSRDYFQIKRENITYEIVPVLKITKPEQAKNITDISLLHTGWVNEHSRYADDIRLMKQFCKSAKIYGAESYIKGFSGYICEILVIHYKGFMKLVRAASKWKEKTVIDTEKYYKGKKEILFNLNKAKTEGPLVLVDPVQKTRNAAAALSEEKYAIFIDRCKKFLKKESLKFFEIHEITEDELKKKAKKDKLIIVKAESRPGKTDVAGSKLLKVYQFIKQKLGEKEFKLKDLGWRWDKEKDALFWFIVDKKKLSAYQIREGPPKKEKIYVEYFKKRHPKTFVKGRKVYAREKRDFREADKLISALIEDGYVKDKVKAIMVEN